MYDIICITVCFICTCMMYKMALTTSNRFHAILAHKNFFRYNRFTSRLVLSIIRDFNPSNQFLEVQALMSAPNSHSHKKGLHVVEAESKSTFALEISLL